jgi:hypothetical protein
VKAWDNSCSMPSNADTNFTVSMPTSDLGLHKPPIGRSVFF